MIPKIIHYCWLSNDPVPADLQKYMKSWQVYLSDFEFIKWDFSRFDINKSHWVKEAFENKKYAFAADYIRLYALYNYGGFYLDMDVEVLKNFDSLLELDTAICWQNNKEGLEVAVFGVSKGVEWVKKCLDYYNDKSFLQPNGNFDTKVLPLIVYNQLLMSGYNLLDVSSIKEAISYSNTPNIIPVFSSDYFSPKSYKTGLIELSAETYCIHHFAASWLPFYLKCINSTKQKLGVNGTGIIVKLKKIISFLKH